MATDIKVNVDSMEPGKVRYRPGLDEKEKALGPAYAEYRRRWVEWPGQQYVGEFAIHMDLEITSVCDLACIMCPRTLQIKEKSFRRVKHIEWDLFIKCVDEGARYGLCSIKFNVLGEPLLHPRVVDMVKYCKDKGLIEVMFNTNATHLTEELGRRLIEAGLDRIIFSVDSIFKEEYERIRVNADFDEVIGNIRRFCELKQELGAFKPLTRVNMAVFNENHHGLGDLIAYFRPIVDAISYGELAAEHLKENAGRIVIPRRDPDQFCCAQMWQRIMIWVDGTVMPCCSDLYGELKLGNAWTDSLYELWHGPELTRFREIHKRGAYRELAACRKCSIPRMAASDRIPPPDA